MEPTRTKIMEGKTYVCRYCGCNHCYDNCNLSFLEPFPRMVTEEVQVKAVDQNGCHVQTYDGFVIHIPPCNAKPRDNITATFDGKIRARKTDLK